MSETNGAPEPAQQQGVPAIEVNDLSYRYKNRRALSHVTFAVTPRAIHGFVGPNGAGKTTTLKVLATLLTPASGWVRIFGHDVTRDYGMVRRRIGFMPDYFGMYRQMTVYEYLDFFGAAYGMGTEERDRTIRDILQLTDMSSRQNDLIKSLSRGMQQRVSLARLLVHDPDLLLLDEPASGLDPRARIELMAILRELRRMGKTIFISSHILAELATLCDSVTIIDRGAIRFSGPMDQLLSGDGVVVSYTLRVAAMAPAVEPALRALDGVTEVKAVEEERAYRVSFHRAQLSLNAVLNAVIANGGELAAVREDQRQLDQAFMDLTQPGVPT